MTSSFDRLAEQRIDEAIRRGDFDDLPGHGKPLDLEDLSRVPAELRAGYMLLRSAGVLPEEMELRKECLRLSDLIAACTDDTEVQALRARRSALALRYELLMERRGRTSAHDEYAARIHRRLG